MTDEFIQHVGDNFFTIICGICAIALPYARYRIRKSKGYKDGIDWNSLAHDMPNGFFLPQALMILISPLSSYLVPDIKTIAACSFYAILLIIRDVRNVSDNTDRPTH